MKTYNNFVSDQEGSPKTSRKMVARGFKKIDWKNGTSNFDLGGGKYEEATSWLKKHHDVTNIVYDPYNRSSSHNMEAWINADNTETTTVFNVLNVIPTEDERIRLLKQAKHKNTRHIYIIVYEKDGSGVGSKTRDGWQNNMPLKDYFPEVQKVFGSAYIKNGMIIVNV